MQLLQMFFVFLCLLIKWQLAADGQNICVIVATIRNFEVLTEVCTQLNSIKMKDLMAIN